MNAINHTYQNLTPVEIVEYLCHGSANGYRENAVTEKEARLGIVFPTVIRTYLLRVGMECISARVPILQLDNFQIQNDYLIFGYDIKGLLGILLEDLSKESQPVYVQDASANWQLFTESLTAYLLIEIEHRILETQNLSYVDYHLERPERYYYCTDLHYWDLTYHMDASAVYNTFRNDTEYLMNEHLANEDYDNEDYEEEDYEEEDYGDNDDLSFNIIKLGTMSGKYPIQASSNSIKIGPVDYHVYHDHLICPEELKVALQKNSITVPRMPYTLGLCFDSNSGTLYSGHLMPDGRFQSLLQINAQLTVELSHMVDSQKLDCSEKLLTILADEVHDPVMAYCLTQLYTLPEKIYSLAEKELHSWIANDIGDFLNLFEKKNPWKLGVITSDTFVECSHLSHRETLPDFWSVRHLKAAPSHWTPSFSRTSSEKMVALEPLEPFIKELIYRVHDYNLLNRYTFLARKMVTNGGFSKKTENYTDDERFALLSFYRVMMDGVLERLLYCLEQQLFTIRIKGQDILTLCPNPLTQMEGWLRQYGRNSLDFLDTGKWQ